MSANVLMISEQSFKDFTVASANIDLKNVTQVIKEHKVFRVIRELKVFRD